MKVLTSSMPHRHRHVVVGQFLALQLGAVATEPGGRRLDIERGALVRVLAVAHRLGPAELEVQGARERVTLPGGVDAAQVIRDGPVIAGRVFEGLDRERKAGGIRHAAALPAQLRQHRPVVGAVDQHGDGGMVLGRGAQQGGPADIDVLDRHRQVAVRARHGLLEGVQIDHDHVDRRNTVFRHHRLVEPAAGKDAAMHLRVQRLDAPVHHLREAGEVGDLDHRDTGIGEQARRAAGGQDLDAQRRKPLREFADAALV